LCRDGNSHEGRLELITWDCPEEGKGWGAYFADESESLKRKFEIEFESDEEKLFDYWPRGFRWTCCGGFTVTYPPLDFYLRTRLCQVRMREWIMDATTMVLGVVRAPATSAGLSERETLAFF
jgi:hypothetical protein